MKNPTLLIRRSKSYSDSLRSYKVFIDGNEVGLIKNGMESRFCVAPGEHLIHLKIDWCKTPRQKFSISYGEEATFECGSNVKGVKLLLAPIYALFLPSSWICLKKV